MALSLRLLDLDDGGGSLTVVASDVVPGEFLLCYVDGDNGSAEDITSVDGWTEVWHQPGNNANRNVKVFALPAGANGSYEFTNPAGSDGTAALVAIAGDGTLTIDDVEGATTGASDAPSVTTAADDSMLLCYWVEYGNGVGPLVLVDTQMSVWLDNHDSAGWGVRLGATEIIPTAGPTGTRTANTAHSSISIAMSETAGATDLTVDSTSHAQTAGTPDLSQVHELGVDSTTHGQVADAAALTQTHQLGVDSATHAQTAGQPALTQVHELTPEPATHAQTAGSPEVALDTHLAVESATHAQTAGSPALAQVHQLTPASATHAQTAGAATLTQVHVLSVDDAVHLQHADAVTLTLGELVTPPQRVSRILPEDRTSRILPDKRVSTIHAESRVSVMS